MVFVINPPRAGSSLNVLCCIFVHVEMNLIHVASGNNVVDLSRSAKETSCSMLNLEGIDQLGINHVTSAI